VRLARGASVLPIGWFIAGAVLAAAQPVAAAQPGPVEQGPVVIYPTRPPARARAQIANPTAPLNCLIPAVTSSADVPAQPEIQVSPQSPPAAAPPPTPAAAQPPAPAAPAFNNPFGRDVDLTMALTYADNELGDIPVTLTRDNHIYVHTAEFSELIEPLLNKAGIKGFEAAVGGRNRFEPDTLRAAGITLEFDPSALSVVILKIDPTDQLAHNLYRTTNHEAERARAPSSFSAYVNLSGAGSWAEGAGFSPFFDVQGVIHYDHLVFESDFTAQNQVDLTTLDNSFDIQRRYARLVYDVPEDYLRFYLGDLTPEFRGDQGDTGIGGFGVVRERNIYDPDRVSALTGSQQLVLQNEATVDVMRNGSLIQQLHLAAGAYNLNNLPLTTGSNNIQLEVHDITGAVRTITYSTFLDPIDLQPGDYEYAAYVGALSQTLIGSPDYNGGVAFTGFYRKAFQNSDAVGVGLQAGRDVQMADGELRLPLKGGARLDFDVAASHSDFGGAGGSISGGFEELFDRGGLIDSLTLQVGVNTKFFAVLGNTTPIDPTAWQVSMSYSHAFTQKFQTTAELEYSNLRDPKGNSATLDIENFYELNREWSVRFGVSYQDSPGESQRGFGALVGLVWRPDREHRAEARYDGSRDQESLTFTKSSENFVGSYGYTGIIQQSQGQASISGEAEYYADRAAIDFQAGTSGGSFGAIGTTPTATLSVSTAIGYVDGHFGIGHPISDSFVIAYPHASLDNRSVIVGDDLEEGHFGASSGILGPALYAFLPSYNPDILHYDVVNPPLGYDIGEGTTYLRPLYRSGFALQVGSDAFISVTGTLVNQDGKPISLSAGSITNLDDPKASPAPFFTNSVGRFAAEGLKPGVRYKVDLNAGAPVSFTFVTPKKGVALVDLRKVIVNAPVD
jgi:outer membrane usher protein